MNYADLRPFDTSNGSGISTTLFVSGCNFHCKNCFNENAWDFKFNEEFTKEIEDKFIKYAKNPHVNHISLLGGEIFHQDLDVILNLVKRIKNEVDKPICVWTGFPWNELLNDKRKVEILKYIDILTDGRFDINKKDLNLKFKGSSNQKTIDVKQSLEKDVLVEYNWI